jgi:hypothetical protein
MASEKSIMDSNVVLDMDQEFESLCPPLLPEEERLLEDSLKTDGCREPILAWSRGDRMILIDGHNRYRLCRKNGIGYDVQGIQFHTRKDAIVWILRNQLGRRNLSESQRAILAARLVNGTHGGDHKSDQVANLQLGSLADVAEKCNVSKRSVSAARTVLKSGDKQLIAEVQAGKVSVSKAEKAVKEKKRGSCGPLPKNQIASSALDFAVTAISQLERIQKDDPGRDNAFDKVEVWLSKQNASDITQAPKPFVLADELNDLDKGIYSMLNNWPRDEWHHAAEVLQKIADHVAK